MNRSLVLSILSDDKPGVVEALAKTINDHQGNWLESQMSQLAGKFAGILHISIAEDQLPLLKQALEILQQQQEIQIISAEVDTDQASAEIMTMEFSLMGNDRPGIIREISQAFVSHHINFYDLHTQCSSMPMAGIPMFTAQGKLHVPGNLDLDNLTDQLEDIANELGIDFELKASSENV